MNVCEFRFYLPDLVHLLLDPVDEPPLDDPLNVLVLVLICHLDYYANEGNKYFTIVRVDIFASVTFWYSRTLGQSGSFLEISVGLSSSFCLIKILEIYYLLTMP